MSGYGSPPMWQIVLVVAGLLALPCSAVVGLAGWWLWQRLFERDLSSRTAPDA
jgi:hypothetical protein